MTTTSFVRNQWYVAAYGYEVGRELFSRTICGEPMLFWRTEAGQVTALCPTAACTAASRCPRAQSSGRRPGGLRLPRLHLRRRRWVRLRARPAARSRAPRGSRRTRSSSRTRSSGCGSATATLADATAIPRAPWLDSPGYTTVSRDGAARRALRAARRQPPGPVPRDVSARRLHRHPRGRRDPDHHRGRRGGAGSCASAGTWTTPSARRSTPSPPASTGPHHPLAGHRVPRRRACTCCTAGSPRSASRRRTRTAATRTPSTSRSCTRSPRRRRTPRTTSGPWRATSPSTTRRSAASCTRTTARSSCRTSSRSTCWRRPSPPSATATRS